MELNVILFWKSRKGITYKKIYIGLSELAKEENIYMRLERHGKLINGKVENTNSFLELSLSGEKANLFRFFEILQNRGFKIFLEYPEMVLKINR